MSPRSAEAVVGVSIPPLYAMPHSCQCVYALFLEARYAPLHTATMMTFKTLIASNIDWLMERANTNANDLGKLLGQKKGTKSLQSTIHRIVIGESLDPKTASIQPIAEHFGVSVEQLRTYDFRNAGMPAAADTPAPSHAAIAPRRTRRSDAARLLIDAIEDADRSGIPADAFNALREVLRILRGGAQPRVGRAGIEDPTQ